MAGPTGYRIIPRYGRVGCRLVLLTAIYAWGTVAFGIRFSNLTHRGILTNGPYAWTRHPAYVSEEPVLVAVRFAVPRDERLLYGHDPQHRDPRHGQRRLLLAGEDRGEASLRRPSLCRICPWMDRNGPSPGWSTGSTEWRGRPPSPAADGRPASDEAMEGNVVEGGENVLLFVRVLCYSRLSPILFLAQGLLPSTR